MSLGQGVPDNVAATFALVAATGRHFSSLSLATALEVSCEPSTPVATWPPHRRLVGQSTAIHSLCRHLPPPPSSSRKRGLGRDWCADHPGSGLLAVTFIVGQLPSIPESLLEAEFLGFEAGAFTDAKRAKPGLFEMASGGTLFLDEIDALRLSLQSKLLTAIEAKQVRRVGAVVERPVDVKLIAATPANLSELVRIGQFRPDLYHRLAVIVLELPPLWARGDDILLLAQFFLQQYAVAHQVPPNA